MSKISIIIPVYYNEEYIYSLYDELYKKILSKIKNDYEIIMVDDGSKDNSFSEMKKLSKIDKKVKLIKLSRNFGSHAAILAGMLCASGDCITVKSADQQEPTEIILEMYKKWEKGNKVVLAIRKTREESLSKIIFANFYYIILRGFGLKEMPKGGFDCFLIDKKVSDIICQMMEKNTTLMGQVIWCGFKKEFVYYTRKKRQIGKSKWTFSKKIKLFIDSIVGFSYIPIRTISIIGFIFFFGSTFWAIFLLISKLFGNISVSGWTSLMVVNILSAGLIMITLGIIGEYLWRNFDESRKRPPFIIEEMHGINILKELKTEGEIKK